MSSFLFNRSLLCLCLLTSSCSPSFLNSFEKTGDRPIDKTDLYPVFRPQDSTQLFSMQIDYKKQHFSGLLLVKPLESGRYRLVFTTHFGMRVFDFELGADVFIRHFCLPPLEKKVILNTLEKDFSILLFLKVQSSGNKATVYRHKKREELEINKLEDCYYLKDTEKKELLSVVLPHWLSTLRYDFSNYQSALPADIEIGHSRIGLRIALKRVARGDEGR